MLGRKLFLLTLFTYSQVELTLICLSILHFQRFCTFLSAKNHRMNDQIVNPHTFLNLHVKSFAMLSIMLENNFCLAGWNCDSKSYIFQRKWLSKGKGSLCVPILKFSFFEHSKQIYTSRFFLCQNYANHMCILCHKAFTKKKFFP